MKRVALTVLLFVLSIMVLPREAHAADSYYNCTGFIDSVPAVITSPGNWCLNKDLSVSYDALAIQVAADNVVIDCKGFRLDGPGGANTQAGAIFADGQLDVTVRNCNIRGFNTGIIMYGGKWTQGGRGGNFLIEDNRLEDSSHIAILIEGDNSTIRRNQIFNSGGASEYEAYNIGIGSYGAVDILDNTVSGVLPPMPDGASYGILSEAAGASSNISGNVVRGVVYNPGSPFSVAYSIIAAEADMVNITDNQLFGDGTPKSVGASCQGQHISPAKDNTINGFVAGLDGCSDEGGNVINP